MLSKFKTQSVAKMSSTGKLLGYLLVFMVLLMISTWFVMNHTHEILERAKRLGHTTETGGKFASLLQSRKALPASQEKVLVESIPESAKMVSANRPKFNVVKTSAEVAKESDKEEDNDDKNSVSVIAEPEKIAVNSSISKGALHTVTYASHGGRDDRFCRAVESAIRHNFDLVILGWKVPWRGLSQKLEAAHAYAASLPPDDLILFTDAFDVLFTDSPAHIQTKFEQGQHQILFSAECGCWPHIIEKDREACFKHYPTSPTPYRYLNSGAWIGKAAPSAVMLAEVMKEAGNNFGNANDQKLVADMYIAGRHGIKLDFHNAIFQSMHMTLDPPLPRCNPIEDIVLTSDKRYHNERTDSYPAVIHFNGGGKAHHLKMESQIWYKSASYNTIEERKKLAAHLLTVPSMPGGKLRFDQICGDYLRHT